MEAGGLALRGALQRHPSRSQGGLGRSADAEAGGCVVHPTDRTEPPQKVEECWKLVEKILRLLLPGHAPPVPPAPTPMAARNPSGHQALATAGPRIALPSERTACAAHAERVLQARSLP